MQIKYPSRIHVDLRFVREGTVFEKNEHPNKACRRYHWSPGTCGVLFQENMALTIIRLTGVLSPVQHGAY